MIFCGTILGFISFGLTQPTLDIFQWLLVAVICTIPSLLNEILKITNRKLKHSIRLLNGVGFGGFFWAFLTLDLIGKSIAVIVAGSAYIFLRTVRRRRMSYDICEGCIELSQRGVCSGLKQEAEAMRKYSDYLSNNYQEKMKKNFIQRKN